MTVEEKYKEWKKVFVKSMEDNEDLRDYGHLKGCGECLYRLWEWIHYTGKSIKEYIKEADLKTDTQLREEQEVRNC